MTKIFSSIKNFRDRLRASVTIKPHNVLFFFALFLVVILAIIIRLSPAFMGNYLIKAFDPWIQYYNAEYLSTHSLYDYFHWHDYKSWYPGGFERYNLRPGLTFTVVAIYNIFKFLGIPVSLYDVCFFFPAFMGGLTVYATYLLGKEILDRRLGLIAAFFMAFVPGYMQRTVAGFFDNETIGVFSTIMTLYFFVKTIRTGKIRHGLYGGFFLGYLSLSWGGYYFVFYLLPVVVFIIILTKKYNTNVLIAYAGIEGMGMMVFLFYINFHFYEFFTSIALGGTFFFTIILIIYHLIHTKRNQYPKFYNKLINFVKWGLIPIILILAVIIWIDPNLIPFGFGGRLQSILSPLLRDTLNLTASVAEHAPSAWSVFYYNTLIPLTLIPLGLFFLLKRSNPADILLIVFVILLFYFTGSMIRIILLFAPAACIVGAYGLVNILKIFGSFSRYSSIRIKRKRQLRRIVGYQEAAWVYGIVGIMLLAQVWHAANYSAVQLSQAQIAPGDAYHDWEETLTWMKTNLPGSTVVVSWWDYGYWITPIGNMTTVNDNGTINSTRIGLTGMAMMQTDELYSAKIFRLLKAEYVLVYFGYLFNPLGGDEGKWPWMLRICNDHYETYKSWGLKEDNWAANSVFDESEYFNETAGRPTKKWFDAQIVELMFYGINTDPYQGETNTFEQYYRSQINNRLDNDGDSWATNVPAQGIYDFKVFRPYPYGGYFSRNGFVKLYKMDYTALESSFRITNPEVFDTGYATFNIKNTGTKNLTITDVLINNESYSYYLGKGLDTNIVPAKDNDLIWVDIKSGGTKLTKNDVVDITVEARSVALEGRPYVFSNSTTKFFVKEALPSKIKINEANSEVIQINENQADIYLEVENIGDSVVVLDEYYADSKSNTFIEKEYLTGSPILNPGEKAYVHITNTIVPFWPIGTTPPVHMIGIITPGGVTDEILMTSHFENYKIELLGNSRILTPEASIMTNSSLRKHIPIELDKTYAYTYDNGTTILNIRVKNTGNIPLVFDSLYLTDEWEEVYLSSQQSKGTILPNGGKTIKFVVPDEFNINVNDEIGILISYLFDATTKTSDVGFVQSLNSSADIQIIEDVFGTQASYIAANETGRLLIKNTGVSPIKLDSLYLNETTVISIESDVNFIYGDVNLDFQECALISFDITNLEINASNTLNLKVTTNTTAVAYASLNSYVDTNRYNIEIDESTYASNSGNVVIRINNLGLLNVTVNSVYINNTFIPLASFTETIYEIVSEDSIDLTISMIDLEAIIGTIDQGDTLVIVVRTVEGAEDIHKETVSS
ncbi:MAG: STT3 domain-containing protein [Candidatus Hermodarchaeota archaeon]